MADSLPLPSISELANMDQMAPGLNQLAGQNLAMQQTNAGLQNQMAGQDLQSKTLDNLFQQQNDPTKLLQNQATMQGTTADNILKNINNKIAGSTVDEATEAKRQKFLADASDDKLNSMLSDAITKLSSPNTSPADQATAQHVFDNSKAELAKRSASDYQLKNTDTMMNGRKDIAALAANAKIQVGEGNNATSISVQGLRNQSQMDKLQAAAKGGKQNLENLITSEMQAAASATDPAEREYHTQIMNGATQIMYGKAVAGQTGKPDVGPLTGMPTRTMPAIPTPPQAPPMGNTIPVMPVRNPAASAQEALPPPVPDMPGMADFRNNSDLKDLNVAYQSARDPAQKAAIAEQARVVMARQKQAAPAAPTAPVTQTYQGKTYVLKPGTDRAKKENWIAQ